MDINTYTFTGLLSLLLSSEIAHLLLISLIQPVRPFRCLNNAGGVLLLLHSLCICQHGHHGTTSISTAVLVCSFTGQGDRPKMVGSDWTVGTGGDQWDVGIVDLLDEEFQKANGGLSLKGDAMALTR